MSGAQGFPQINAPIADVKTGMVSPVWLALFRTLFMRTGQAQGVDASTVQATADDARAQAQAAVTTANGAAQTANSLTSTVTTAQAAASDAETLAAFGG